MLFCDVLVEVVNVSEQGVTTYVYCSAGQNVHRLSFVAMILSPK